MASANVSKKSAKSSVREVALLARVERAREVAVTGDFTRWSENGIPLTSGPDGEWRATLQLAPGEYQYRLRVDGAWRDHSEAQKRVPNPFGTENCVLRVS